jgi:hypothetical protein
MDSKRIEAAAVEQWARKNGLLGRLDHETFHHLLPLLKPATLYAQEILYKPGEHISDIYFPDTAVLCMLTIMKDGRSIEAAILPNRVVIRSG